MSSEKPIEIKLTLDKEEIQLLMTVITVDPERTMRIILEQTHESIGLRRLEEHIREVMAPQWDILRKKLNKHISEQYFENYMDS